MLKMFRGLTRSKFCTKCKSSVKITKTRLEIVRKKKNTVAKYLKNDLAELMRIGLDYNAYSRADGLLLEQTILACYDLIEQFCDCILSNLSAMDKQKECPEECKEAVQSLIYAAARFAEFPELRDLRTLFTSRYGTSLEPFVNKEFVDKLRTRAKKDQKLQLMHDIAEEFSIEWNPKSLEQELFKPPPLAEDQHGRGSLNNQNDDGCDITTVQERDNRYDDGYKLGRNQDDSLTEGGSFNGGQEVNNTRKNSRLTRNERKHSPHGRKNVDGDDRYRQQSSSSEDDAISCSWRDSTDHGSLHTSSSCSVASLSEDESDIHKKPLPLRFIPPPYFRPQEKGKNLEEPPKQIGSFADLETNDQDDLVDAAKPKPKSSRRRHSKKPFPGDGNGENAGRLLRASDAIEAGKSRQSESLPVSPGRAERSSTEAAKGHGRSISVQPEMLMGHVHPNLPDYDELVARIAALKGR